MSDIIQHRLMMLYIVLCYTGCRKKGQDQADTFIIA